MRNVTPKLGKRVAERPRVLRDVMQTPVFSSSALSMRLPVSATMHRFGSNPVARLAEKASLSRVGDDYFDVVALRLTVFGKSKRVVLGLVSRQAISSIAPDLDPEENLLLRIIDLGNTHLPGGEPLIFASVWHTTTARARIPKRPGKTWFQLPTFRFRWFARSGG